MYYNLFTYVYGETEYGTKIVGHIIYDRKNNEYWYDNCRYHHRDGGPAIMFEDGSFIWYKHGLKHRLDGPAVFHNNHRYNCKDDKEWWIDGEQLSEEEFIRIMKLKSFF
jgi:hypothetical protein